MKISDFFTPADVVIDMRTSQKQQVLQELAGKASAGLGLQADYVASELLKREALGSTGMGSGVAIPHARLPMVKRPRGVLARLKPAVDFDAIDGQPVDLVFLLLLAAPPEPDQLTAPGAGRAHVEGSRNARSFAASQKRAGSLRGDSRVKISRAQAVSFDSFSSSVSWRIRVS